MGSLLTIQIHLRHPPTNIGVNPFIRGNRLAPSNFISCRHQLPHAVVVEEVEDVEELVELVLDVEDVDDVVLLVDVVVLVVVVVGRPG